MERSIARTIICGLVVLMTTGTSLYQTAGAQDYVAPPVSISKDKVKIDGKVFYSHIVLEKQTLFSISKAYNVSIEDIYRHNPSLKVTGLRKNDIINIPVAGEVQEKQERQERQERQNTAEEIKIQPRQQEQEQTSYNSERKHVVKWYEDLSTIAAKYNVSEDAIVKANGLKERRVKSRQVLVIPVKEQPQNADSSISGLLTQAGTILQEENEAEENTELDQTSDTLSLIEYWNIFMKKSAHATLILPFKATGTTSNRNNMDLYSGVLLAAREFKEEGTELHLNVYDMATGTSGIPAEVLKTSDIIIGPVAPEDIEQIAGMVHGACPIVSPLDQRAEKLTSKYRNLIQAPASQYAQFVDIAQWIGSDMTERDKVIVISEKEARQNDAGRVLRSVIDRCNIHYTPFSYSILEGRDIQATLEAAMTKEGVNRVVIASESEAFVNDAVRNLNLIVHNKYDVVLYAPAKIRTFETIEVENFHNTSLHASLSYYINYDNDSGVKDFIKKYRAMFGTEPTQFAFQGYDLARYFIGLITQYPTNWMSYLTEGDGTSETLQSRFAFMRNGYGGYVNGGVRRIEYRKDYSIIEVPAQD